MRERGYGPGELAYQSGLSYNYVYKIRKGLAPNIAAAQVQKLARALRTTPDYLMGLSNVSAPGDDYEVISGRAELAPEVEDLAQRVDDLPESLRTHMVRLMVQALALVDELRGPATLSEPQKLMLAYFEQLNEANQDLALAELQRLLAEPGAGADERTDARGSA